VKLRLYGASTSTASRVHAIRLAVSIDECVAQIWLLGSRGGCMYLQDDEARTTKKRGKKRERKKKKEI
jgi:hypothetical protein